MPLLAIILRMRRLPTPMFVLACSALIGQTQAAVRSYQLYQPEVRHTVIHEGRLAPGHYAYNHMASVEWFDGRFHCVWGAHAETHLEGKPGQVNVWSTTTDLARWSAPGMLAHAGPAGLPRDSQGVQWQPNLLNYQDRQLWCVWSFNSRNPELDGLFLSTLDKGASAWNHRRIRRRQEAGGFTCSIFASQNPVLLASGRVLAPVTLNHRDPKHDAGGEHPAKSLVRRFNACFYTDDGGSTWQCSNPVSAIDDPEAQWEPFFYEQSDGRIRAYMRNFTKGIPHGTQWRYTATGAGSATGEPLVLQSDPVFSFMETVNCRPQVFRVPGGRYCLLQQDAFTNHRDYATRLNLALHFSRTGADDFVAGPPISRPDVISAYPQGVARDGKIIVAYTTGPGDQPRSIESAIVSPVPANDQYYIWPRAKELVMMENTRDDAGKRRVVRTNPNARTALPVPARTDGRPVLRFAGRASAGVDIDSLDFAAGDKIELRFQVKPLRLQPRGMMIFCSFGDRMPIRLGMPANRPGKLYAYGRNQWQPVGDLPLGQWQPIRLEIGRDSLAVQVNEGKAQILANPLVDPAARLYLGDGFEVDYLTSNAGSEFVVDIASVSTEVTAGKQAAR